MVGESESSGLAVSTAPGVPSSHWLPENPITRRPAVAAAAGACKTSSGTHEGAMSKNKNGAPSAAPEHPLDVRRDLFEEIQGHGLEGVVVVGEGGGGERARCEWDFRLCSVISPAATREASDALGAIEFDPSDQFVATGGIARKIRIYTLGSLLPQGEWGDVGGGAAFSDHAAACSYYICTPAKLSSLRWRPDCGSRVIGAGDYDGVVTEYDLERRLAVFERDEHDGRRVWSVDYSRWIPQLGASGSDNGTAQMWDSRCGGDVSSLCPAGGAEPRQSVCCVEFDPSGGSALIGLGCADRRAYVYDLRRASDPVTVFRGHRRTVTYLRFVGGGRVVSAGTDGCLRLWDLLDGREARAYEGHANTRSFVGLSVWRAGGLLSCGSETNEVYVYDMRWGEPIWVGGFEGAAEEGGRGFVSSVCWRQAAGDANDACTIVAGSSNGVLQVFGGRRKPTVPL